jgi:hypothetical protein
MEKAPLTHLTSEFFGSVVPQRLSDRTTHMIAPDKSRRVATILPQLAKLYVAPLSTGCRHELSGR